MEIILILPVMIWIGYSDFKSRIIPNRAILILLLIGVAELILGSRLFFSVSVSERVFGFLVPTIFLLLVYIKNSRLSGGGDLKLLGALGACIGIYNLATILFFSIIGGIYHFIRYKEKYIPLGTYAAVASFVYAGIVVWKYF